MVGVRARDERNGGSMSHSSPAATLHDFDFLFGSWRIHNRRLDDPLGDSESWSEFEASSEAYPILNKLGNVQHFDAPRFPGRPGFQGYALRRRHPPTEPQRARVVRALEPARRAEDVRRRD
jgi:hypothetical protein